MRHSEIPEEPEEPAHQFSITSRQKDPADWQRSAKHVIALAFRVTGELRLDDLQAALDEVAARHDALHSRVSFDETDGNRGSQVVLPPQPVPFIVHDVPLPPGKARDDKAVELFVALHDELLPFTVTPSLRVDLHRFDDRDGVLTFLTHHLYSDGWSVEILRRDFVACYRARLSGIPHGLADPVQYREFESWEREFLQGPKAEAARRFWMDKLVGAELYTLPADRAHGPDTLHPKSAVRTFPIGPDDFARVSASATENRCTVWHLCLAATMVLAHRLRDTTDITLLTVSSGRPVEQFYETIGFFANLVPIRLEFADCTSFRDLMLHARRANADAHRYQVPFEMIRELFPDLMKSFEDPWAVPPAFTYLSSFAALADDESAVSIEPVVLPEEVPSMFHRGGCLVNFTVLSSGEFRFVVEYEPDAADQVTVDRWGTDFVDLMLAIADRPDQAWRTW